MGRASRAGVFALLWLLLFGAPGLAQNYQILRQELDGQRHGYTVIRVSGSHREMGRALGQVFSQDILAGLEEVKNELGQLYDTARSVIANTDWRPRGILDELEGMVEGIKSAQPQAAVDSYDLMVANTYGDWGYYGGCRSHQAWGSFCESPTRTLSTRRLDFGTPFDMVLHHVLIAFDPSDGSDRWVNLAWPGYVAVITGVNANGTLVSLHDYATRFQVVSGGMLRCVATRWVLTDAPASLPLEEHLGWAEEQLGRVTFTTGTFINYYAPAGFGGVFTCVSGGSCGKARKPNATYFDGEVLITTNSQTDGASVPSGGEFMDEYYRQGKPKRLADHFQLMGTSGLHLISVDYRAREDMTIWFIGRGMSNRVELEWRELFPAGPAQDAADGGQDGGDGGGQADDNGSREDGGDQGYDSPSLLDGGQGGDQNGDSGCDCGSAGDGGQVLLGLCLLAALVRGRFF